MKTKIIQNEPDNRTTTAISDPARPGIAGWIRRHRLITFFVLAFVLAWWSWPRYQFDIWPRRAFNAVGALLTAIVVIAVAEGRAGFRDLGKRMMVNPMDGPMAEERPPGGPPPAAAVYQGDRAGRPA